MNRQRSGSKSAIRCAGPSLPPADGQHENGDTAEDHLDRRSVERVGRALERSAAKLVPGCSVIVERTNGTTVLIADIPAANGEGCDFRCKITVRMSTSFGATDLHSVHPFTAGRLDHLEVAGRRLVPGRTDDR
jgi:hypothetical protein